MEYKINHDGLVRAMVASARWASSDPEASDIIGAIMEYAANHMHMQAVADPNPHDGTRCPPIAKWDDVSKGRPNLPAQVKTTEAIDAMIVGVMIGLQCRTRIEMSLRDMLAQIPSDVGGVTGTCEMIDRGDELCGILAVAIGHREAQDLRSAVETMRNITGGKGKSYIQRGHGQMEPHEDIDIKGVRDEDD